MPEKGRPEGLGLTSPWGPKMALKGGGGGVERSGERELFLADR